MYEGLSATLLHEGYRACSGMCIDVVFLTVCDMLGLAVDVLLLLTDADSKHSYAVVCLSTPAKCKMVQFLVLSCILFQRRLGEWYFTPHDSAVKYSETD